MRARSHGEQPTASQDHVIAEGASLAFFSVALAPPPPPPPPPPPSVGFMFGPLTDDPNNRVPEGQATIDALSALGIAMSDESPDADSRIPAAYTYFGQFVDHDIGKTAFDPSLNPAPGKDAIEAATLSPLDRARVPALVQNLRSPLLDLDSVYEVDAVKFSEKRAFDASGKFNLSDVVETHFPTAPPIQLGDRKHDLLRRDMIVNAATPEENDRDREAVIGDPRNDENLLVAQLHVALQRSHNVLIDRGLTPEAAKKAILRRYQWSVLADFLGRICDKSVVSDVLTNGPKFWKIASNKDLFMPVEFSAAAYRFGHSMIRAEYRHNSTFGRKPNEHQDATFNFFFTFTALSGDIQPGAGQSFQFATLPDNWPIEWHRFFDTAAGAAQNFARRIDTKLTPALGQLRNVIGVPIPSLMAKLAARNLLRGYLLGLPTGQAVADLLGAPPVDPQVLRDAIPSGLRDTVVNAGLIDRTPLWFYILAEAGDPNGPNGEHLGAVGSRIVAEALWNFTKHSGPDNVIDNPPTAEELATNEFTLQGLIRIGQDKLLPPI